MITSNTILLSGTDAGGFGAGMTTLMISNEEVNDIMEIIKSLEEADLLRKGVSETIENEAKEQNDGFRGML